jgi:hypothetical protein
MEQLSRQIVPLFLGIYRISLVFSTANEYLAVKLPEQPVHLAKIKRPQKAAL